MNTAPTIKITEEGPEVGVATARLLLQHALAKEEQIGTDEPPEVTRKRAINDLTGASIQVPPKVMAEEECAITTKCSDAEATRQDNVMWDKRNRTDARQSSLQ